MDRFPLQRFEEIRAHPERFRLLEAVPYGFEHLPRFPQVLAPARPGQKLHQIVFLGGSYTQRGHVPWRLTGLGLVRVTYDFRTRQLLTIDQALAEFEPGDDSEAETSLTAPAGLKFNTQKLSRLLSGRPLVVSHAARIFRPLFERRFPMWTDFSWADSLREVDWMELGFRQRALPSLLGQRGWFYPEGTGLEEAFALCHLMIIEPRALHMLISAALKTAFEVTVSGNAYKVREQLKAWGFRYDGGLKRWKMVAGTEDEVLRLKARLSELREFDVSRVDVRPSTAKTRYKG